MEGIDIKVLLIGGRRVISMGYVEDIPCHILLDYEPRTSAKAHALTLADSVKPEAFMFSDTIPRFQFYHITRVLAQVTSQIVIIIDFPQEADTL